MSSASEFEDIDAEQAIRGIASAPPTRASSRGQSRTHQSPRKKRRLDPIKPLNVDGEPDFENKYNDGYRVLFNEEVWRVANGFDHNQTRPTSMQMGASIWTAKERDALFSVLHSRGMDDIQGITNAVGTKNESEICNILMVLQNATSPQKSAKLTLRDIPAAIEVDTEFDEQLEEMADALASYQEKLDATQEQDKYGHLWLITRQIAGDVDNVVAGIAVPITGSDGMEPERRGRGIAGACDSCKKRKLKCNRGNPCSNCVKSQIDCLYFKKVHASECLSSIDLQDTKEVTSLGLEDEGLPNVTSLIQDFPEAKLLQPSVMLKLSRDLFMNRSPDTLSPWLHWSQYASEIATEPAIYRTAFNDLHDLTVSMIRRLVQATIMQSTSRLRTQRRRLQNKKVLPRVKKRDVYAALKVLGLKRNGNDRWIGVARRCGLRVYSRDLESNRIHRRKREVPWSEVESILSSTLPHHRFYTSEPESPTKLESFRQRGIRSATPLPPQGITASESEDANPSDSEPSEIGREDCAIQDSEAQRKSAPWQARDRIGRYTSAEPSHLSDSFQRNARTLEAFDRGASHQEASSLLAVLGIQRPTEDVQPKNYDNNTCPYNESDEMVTPETDDWRTFVTFREHWEELASPLPQDISAETRRTVYRTSHQENEAKFKPSASHIAAIKPLLCKQGSESGPELLTHGTNAYAALRMRDLGYSEDENSGGSEGSDEANIPTQSVESNFGITRKGNSGSEMEWE